MNQIVATETLVETETETVIATAAMTIETEPKAVTVTADETVATTDHDREIAATIRRIAPHHRIATDETAEGTETEAAETSAEAETAIDERALAGTTTETEDQTIATIAAAQPLPPPTLPPSPPVLTPKTALESPNPTPQEALHPAATATVTPSGKTHPLRRAGWTKTKTSRLRAKAMTTTGSPPCRP